MKGIDYKTVLPEDTGDSKKYALDIVTALAHRTITRLWVVIILLICMLVGSVCYIVYRESQFQRVDIVQNNDSSPNNLINGDGDITNGNAKDDVLRP